MKSLEVFYASLREQLSETVCAMQDAGDAALFAEIDAAISQLRAT
nr:hypothetical protein [Stomatobaculum longum]